MINLTPDQLLIAKFAYHASGVIGLLIMRKTRPEFYKNRKKLWWAAVLFFYIYMLGPAVLLFSLITLIPIRPLKRAKRYDEYLAETRLNLEASRVELDKRKHINDTEEFKGFM